MVMEYIVDQNKNTSNSKIAFFSGRIVGFEPVGQNEETLLISVNTAIRRDEMNLVRVPFRNGARNFLENKAKLGDFLTVVASVRVAKRGRYEVTLYSPLRFQLVSRNRVNRPIQKQEFEESSPTPYLYGIERESEEEFERTEEDLRLTNV